MGVEDIFVIHNGYTHEDVCTHFGHGDERKSPAARSGSESGQRAGSSFYHFWPEVCCERHLGAER